MTTVALQKISEFKIDKNIKGTNFTDKQRRAALRNGAIREAYGMRRPLLERLKSMIQKHELTTVTGLPCAGKTELLSDLLDKEMEKSTPNGIGLILKPLGKTYTVDPNQLNAVWTMVRDGYVPEFFVLDEAAECVRNFCHVMDGVVPQTSDPDTAKILDILSRIIGKSKLVLAYPDIQNRNEYIVCNPGKFPQRRQFMKAFYGDSERLVVPSSMSIEDFKKVIKKHIRMMGLKEEAEKLDVIGAIKRLADYIGPYEERISTFFMRNIVRSSKFDTFITDKGKSNPNEIFNERLMFNSLSDAIGRGISLGVVDACVALHVIKGGNLDDARLLNRINYALAGYEHIDKRTPGESLGFLSEQGIITEQTPSGENNLFVRVLESAVAEGEKAGKRMSGY
jgi:hypothetical protein